MLPSRVVETLSVSRASNNGPQSSNRHTGMFFIGATHDLTCNIHAKMLPLLSTYCKSTQAPKHFFNVS